MLKPTITTKDIELALRDSVSNLQLMYKYVDNIDPVPPTIHQLLCNITRLTPYLEDLLKVATSNGWVKTHPSYFEPIRKAVDEIRKEMQNGNEGNESRK
jgi:hypothetical protein